MRSGFPWPLQIKLQLVTTYVQFSVNAGFHFSGSNLLRLMVVRKSLLRMRILYDREEEEVAFFFFHCNVISVLNHGCV